MFLLPTVGLECLLKLINILHLKSRYQIGLGIVTNDVALHTPPDVSGSALQQAPPCISVIRSVERLVLITMRCRFMEWVVTYRSLGAGSTFSRTEAFHCMTGRLSEDIFVRLCGRVGGSERIFGGRLNVFSTVAVRGSKEKRISKQII